MQHFVANQHDQLVYKMHIVVVEHLEVKILCVISMALETAS
jgi:hypothetical protein